MPQSFILDINILVTSKYNESLAGDFYISEIRDLNTSLQLVISFISSGSAEGFPVAIASGINKNFGITTAIADRTLQLNALPQSE